MLRHVRDPYLPPDREAFVAAEPPTGRVIVIAPTRAACETIELALGLHIPTVIERDHGDEIRQLAAARRGFGIVAGTGTGKTLSIRSIAETILNAPLRVGVVNREREATPDTPTWNVIIVTTGIARRWFQDNDILASDTLIVDEIHQTSAELELCLALGKRAGCTFVWLSATVDPTFYANYLASAAVLETTAFDPAKAAKVNVVSKDPLEFLDQRFLRAVERERRGVGMFLPTRASVEDAADHVATYAPRINTAFYHGGEPIRVIRPFLEGTEKKPYFLSMTAAGQSALNVHGLDTVVIDDTRFTNVVERGRNVLTKLHLGPNEILQMAGRVHGRVAGGRVFILSDREIHFQSLRPVAPEFQLAGDSERVAITCADIGVRADELDLPVPLDRRSYRDALALLESRGIVEDGRLTRYGKLVEAMPVDRPWAELLVHADDELLPYVSIMSAIESLHRMTRDERDLDGLIVPGSDHLTAYNLYAEAFSRCGYVGEVYGLPRHLFDDRIEQWAEQRGVLVKAVEDAALGMASVYRAVQLPLPAPLAYARDHVQRRFTDLLARVMPFDLVIDEETASGDQARVSRTSVCGSWGAIAGTLRYFADRFGVPRASIEGTQIPMELVRRYATRGAPEIVFDAKRKHSPLAIRRRVLYFGFELERDTQVLDEFPPDAAADARRALAVALARGEAKHPAVNRNRPAVEEIRELYRRSGGTTPRLGVTELAAMYERQLADVNSIQDFRTAPLQLDLAPLIAVEERERLASLPDSVVVRDRDMEIHYDVEESADGGRLGIARLRLPEKVARTLTEEELPQLDRPLRFIVIRGKRGAVRAATLSELQDALDQPWSPAELSDDEADDVELGEEERAAAQLARRSRKTAARGRGRGKGARGERGGRGGGARRAAGPRKHGGPGRADRGGRGRRPRR
ncbi:MAG TPA: DEAD/DEAH box helicase [Gemmatimonadaceae bacterium]